MNVALINENEAVMNTLDVEIIKSMKGSFTKEDLEREFINLSYNKVIIDITAIKNYYDDTALFNFLTYWEPSKIILVLNDSDFCNNPLLLKKLVENRIYNFTKNAAGVSYLVKEPNKLIDVRKYLEVTMPTPNTITGSEGKEDTPVETPKLKKNRKQKIIGIQGVTHHAGATTLMYMMCKMLKAKKPVKGIEVGSKDSVFLKSEDIITADNLNDLIIKINTLSEYKVIFIDLNGLDGLDICDDILYLVEPGTIRLNKLIKSGQNLAELSKKVKMVLVRSTLRHSDLANFEYETKIKVFANLTDFNDRLDSAKTVNNLLYKLRL